MKKTMLVLSILSIILYACKDEDVINQNDLTSTQGTQDHLTAEQIFNDAVRMVENGLTDNGQNKGCASYFLLNADTTNIDTLIIDFGSTDALCEGKLRNGKIIVTYTGKYRDSLSVITTSFDNYHVDYTLVQGEKIITNKGRNNKGNMWFTIEVNNASINTTNGTINWESSRVREWVSGQNTYFNISDDRYMITGNASGNSVNGKDFTMEITDSLEVDLGCLPTCVIKSGKAKISPNGYSDRIINYGDSICDCNFDVSINGTNYPIIVN
jgi:hypothetical protein